MTGPYADATGSAEIGELIGGGSSISIPPMPAGSVPREQAPVEAQSQRLQQALDQLHAAISSVEDRLGSCLTPNTPKDEQVMAHPEQSQSALASTVKTWADQIQMTTARIEEIRGRVEL